MRPIVMIDLPAGRIARFVFKVVLVLALVVLGVYVAYGTVAAIAAAGVALGLLILIGRLLVRLLRGGGD